MRITKERRESRTRLVIISLGTLLVWITLVVFAFKFELVGVGWAILRLVPAFMIISFISWIIPAVVIIAQNSSQGFIRWITYELFRNAPVMILVYFVDTTMVFKVVLFMCSLSVAHQLAFIWDDVGFLRSNELCFWVWRMKQIARRHQRELPVTLQQFIVRENLKLGTPESSTAELKLAYFESALRTYIAGGRISDECAQLEQQVYRMIAEAYSK